MLKKIMLCALVFLPFITYGQLSAGYNEWVKKANEAYEAKHYLESANAFTKAFASNNGKGMPDDRYNAACSWAQAGNKDSAFFMLMRIAEKANYSNLPHLVVDIDLTSLHNDSRWSKLCELVKQNKDKEEANLNKPLVATLDTILQDDQADRMKIDDVRKIYGVNSKEVNELWKIINKKDSVNLEKVKKILDQYGWVGPDIVGYSGNNTLFLVIQHSDIATQEHYLPMMREAVKNKKAQGSALALLEDRVALRNGRKQIYGSQIGINKDGTYYIDAMEDPDNVDKRRAEVGLNPLAEYVKHWDIKWDLEAYKKQLPELEKKLKTNK